MFNACPVLYRMADMEAELEQEITENKDGRDSHSCELNSVALNCFLNNVVSYFFIIKFLDFASIFCSWYSFYRFFCCVFPFKNKGLLKKYSDFQKSLFIHWILCSLLFKERPHWKTQQYNRSTIILRIGCLFCFESSVVVCITIIIIVIIINCFTTFSSSVVLFPKLSGGISNHFWQHYTAFGHIWVYFFFSQ